MPLVERTWQEQFWSFWRGLEIIHQRSGCENYPSNEQQAVAICGKKGSGTTCPKNVRAVKPPYELPRHAPTRQSNDGLSGPYFLPPGQLTRLPFMPL